MADVTAKFNLNNDNLNAKFDLSEENTVDAVFKIDAAGTTWGSIDGDLSNQSDLQAALDLKADKTDLDSDVELINQTINENYTTLDGKITTLSDTVDNNNTAVNNRINTLETSLDADIDELNTHLSDLSDTVSTNYTELSGNIQNEAATRAENDTLLQEGINLLNNNLTAEISNREAADNTLQGNINTLSNTVSTNYNTLDNKIDGVNSDLSEDIETLQTTVSSNYNTLDTKIDNTKTELDGDISELTQTVSDNYTALNSSVTSNVSTLNSRIDDEVSTLTTSITNEGATRENADTDLQNQIDALTVASDVVDIVGTYAELQAYDTTNLPVNDIIKVLNDETHENASSYYKWTGSVWDYIGSEGPYYTKSEADNKFVPLTRTINNKALSENITLAASDVGALPDTTVIGSGTLTIQKNGTAVDTFNANATADKSINIEVPITTSELTNNSGFITNAALTDYAKTEDIPTTTSELTNDSGFITNSALTGYALKSEIPEDVSELNNDAGYITDSALSGYATTADLQTGLEAKQDTISDLGTITSNAANGNSAYNTIQTYGNIVTHNANEFADTTLSNVSAIDSNSAVQTALNAKANDSDVVHLAGAETITGHKSFTTVVDRVADGVSAEYYRIKNTGVTNTDTPAETSVYGAYRMVDANEKILGDVRFQRTDAGTQMTVLTARNAMTGSEITAKIVVGVNSAGNVYTEAPASGAPSSILTTVAVNNNQNGYLKMGNGVIMQWGVISGRTISANSAATETITFPIAFTAGTYKIAAMTSTGNGYAQTTFAYSDISETGFKLHQYYTGSGTTASLTARWFVIGR